METMRQDCDILSHQFCGQQGGEEEPPHTSHQTDNIKPYEVRLRALLFRICWHRFFLYCYYAAVFVKYPDKVIRLFYFAYTCLR